MQKTEKVHVIFKTHLDIGFTDLARNVTQKYMEQYIPAAIALAEELAAKKGAAQFVWTTGSWLIDEFMRRADQGQKERMAAAIRNGYIAWHGLPCTTHTELMDSSLFEYGLSLAQKLDRTFAKRTIAAKMTDVPGHTKAIIPLLAKAGIQYLHLGVNPASPMPNVPNVFVWRGADGAEVIVQYAGDYGDLLELDGLKEVMVFAHTGDNCGPPPAAEIERQFAELAERFPGAAIQASTMDRFAEQLLLLKDRLPVVTEEIGDSWIHGAASDPGKLARFRTLLRLRADWMASNRFDVNSEEYAVFSSSLLLVAEHTWGMDEKTFLNDFKNYKPADLAAARKRDVVGLDALPDKYAYLGFFRSFGPGRLASAEDSLLSYSLFESSWREQRAYLDQALAALSADKQAEAAAALTELTPSADVPADSAPLRIGEACRLGRFQAAFAADGSISLLQDINGKQWADEQHRLGQFTYETFGVDNYNTWFQQYVVNIDQTYVWADSDFGKPGIEHIVPQPSHIRHRSSLLALSVVRGAESDHVYAKLGMPSEAVTSYGAPAEILLEYVFGKNDNRIDISLNWFGKQANRLPEAAWLSFSPIVNNPNLWKLDKMGQLISPLDVVRQGNRNLHAVQSGIHYHGADGQASILTHDAALVSPGAPRLLQFDQTFAPPDGGMHMQLHNNIWGTNFPMWYEEDAKFRFALVLEGSA